MQLRVEAFNLLNQARFGQPGARSAGAATFGPHHARPRTAAMVQLAVKYSF